MKKPPTRTTLQKIKRWPSLKRHFAGLWVRIYSGEWHAYWRHGEEGYTSYLESAAVMKFEDALSKTKHCGPEKKIEFVLI